MISSVFVSVILHGGGEEMTAKAGREIAPGRARIKYRRRTKADALVLKNVCVNIDVYLPVVILPRHPIRPLGAF